MNENRRSSDIELAVMAEQIKNIDHNVGEVKSLLEKNYVTKDELALTKDKVDRLEKIIYGIIMAILLAVVGAGMTLLLNN